MKTEKRYEVYHMNIYNLVSFLGIFILLGLAWILSENKKVINWRVIAFGILFQFIFALFIFYLPAGINLFKIINNIVITVLNSAASGAQFVFGRLALPPGMVDENGNTSLGFILAFQAFPAIIFFSALMSILYYLHIIPLVIKGFAFIFTKLMRISGVESLCTTSNIFVGIESIFTIKPHLAETTDSELFTILTASMSTVASNVLAIYVFSLQKQFPLIAGHLISASFLSAPAALMVSKLMIPEIARPKTLGENIQPYYEKNNNLFTAIINGANAGVRLIVGIVALLVAVISLVALTDLCLNGIGKIVGLPIELSLAKLLGYLFYPLTIIIGIPIEDAGIISQIIGERSIITEVAAYQHLASAIENGLIHNPRSIIITTYALCGFAHVASLAIFVGGITTLIPGKLQILSKLGFRGLLAATISCLLTACIAGTLATTGSLLFE
jgi:CNT family concentrative nucleoside transporter